MDAKPVMDFKPITDIKPIIDAEATMDTGAPFAAEKIMDGQPSVSAEATADDEATTDDDVTTDDEGFGTEGSMDAKDHLNAAQFAAAPAPAAAPKYPWKGENLFVNPRWAEKLEPTYNAFKSRGDDKNAAKVRTLQGISTFVWISNTNNLPDLDQAIKSALAKQKSTKVKQMIGLVVYDIPGKDFSGGLSHGEFPPTKEGLRGYKNRYIRPLARKVRAATALHFIIIVEPDVMGNLITTKDQAFVQNVAPFYERGTAYAIKTLQFRNVRLYIDVANGGWLGWDATLEPSKHFSPAPKVLVVNPLQLPGN